MEYNLPATLTGLINGILTERDVSSWRIYGGNQVVISIRFQPEPRHEAKNSTPLWSGDHQTSIAFRKKPPCSVARDQQRCMQWAGTVGQDTSQGIGASSNVDTPGLKIPECSQLFTNKSTACDSGLFLTPESEQYQDGVQKLDTVMGTECNNINIQSDLAESYTIPSHDQSSLASVEKQSMAVNTDTIKTIDRYTNMKRSKVNGQCQVNFATDQSCQATVDIVTIGISTAGLVNQKDRSCQVKPKQSTVCTSMDDLYDDYDYLDDPEYDEACDYDYDERYHYDPDNDDDNDGYYYRTQMDRWNNRMPYQHDQKQSFKPP